MRVKKQKRHRKAVRFYSACFGFREPFKILCDGTFIHHLIAHRLIPADDALFRLLGAQTLLFTTSCVIGELKSLGKEFDESLQAAQTLATARCEHEKRVSAATCVESVIGESNSEHFFVATQDGDIRKRFREIPGVPVIYGLRNSLFLEKPSTDQREFVKSTEEKRLHMSDLEYQKLQKIKLKDKLDTNSTGLPTTPDDSGNEYMTTLPTRSNIARRMLSVTDKSKFKRKKAKGPNPLSCKKKKKKDDSSASKNQDGETGGVAKRKRTRKRKRAQKDAKLEVPAT